MKKRNLFTAVVACIVAACNNQPKPAAAGSADSVKKAAALSTFTSSQLAGYFADTIPCADCDGIITRLDLRKDSSFILEQKYIGVNDSGDHVFYQLGNWTVVDSILRLSEITEGPKQYKIMQPDEITILDNEGVLITGTKLNYSLHRQPTGFVPLKNIPVRGMFAYLANMPRIKICALGKELPVMFTDSTKSMVTAYARLKKADQEKILVEVEGRFINQPAETLVVEKFLRFVPGEKCKD